MVDERSQFRELFAELAAIHGVEIERSGIQLHHSLGIGERYHKLLRDTNRKLKIDHPSMQRQLLLALAVKAMNGILGPEGIVPSALVFGEFPSLRSISNPSLARPSVAERAQAAQEARRHMSEHLARAKIQRTHRHDTSQAFERHYQPGDEVFVWRERVVENRIEWIGSYIVETIDQGSKK